MDGAARDTAENDLFIQKAELAAMMEEVKHLQDGLRRQAQDGHAEAGQADALREQIDELNRQLEETRANRIDDQQLRQIMSDVEVLQQQNAKLREQSAIADRVVAVEAENRELHQRLASSPAAAGALDTAELERLRVENNNLLQLADELQKQFSASGTSLGNSEAIAALKRENESLRAHVAAAETATLDSQAAEVARENEELRQRLQDAETRSSETIEQTCNRFGLLRAPVTATVFALPRRTTRPTSSFSTTRSVCSRSCSAKRTT